MSTGRPSWRSTCEREITPRTPARRASQRWCRSPAPARGSCPDRGERSAGQRLDSWGLPSSRPRGRREATVLLGEDGLGGQVLADLRSAFFAASRFSAFLVCLSARDGLLAVFAAFSFGGLTAFGAFGALAGLAAFTALTGLAFGS